LREEKKKGEIAIQSLSTTLIVVKEGERKGLTKKKESILTVLLSVPKEGREGEG